jgi:hypothetical protein
MILDPLEHYAFILVNEIQLHRPGADRRKTAVILDVLMGAHRFRVPHLEAISEELKIDGQRFARRNADLVGPQLLDLLDPIVTLWEGNLRCRIADELNRFDHVVRIEGISVVELNVVAQIKFQRAVAYTGP